MSDEFLGSPPPTLKTRMMLLRVTSSEYQEFVCVSVVPYGQFTHWWGGRSHECRQDTGQCARCQKCQPVRWKGYLHVLEVPSRRESFLEITHDCAIDLQSKMPERQNWRGIRFKVRRSGKGVRGRYITDVLESRVRDHHLPETKDPIHLLRFLWNANNVTCAA